MKIKLVLESLDDLLKPKKLSVQRRLDWAVRNLNLSAAIDALEDGAKITYKIYNYLGDNMWNEKHINFYHKLISRFPEKIKEEDLPKIILKQSINEKDFKKFKKALELGANLTLSMFKEIKDWDKYNQWNKNKKNYKHWIDYIIKNKDKVFNEKTLKMINQRYLNLSPKLEPRSYPRGYMQYRALKLINDKRIKKRKDVIRLLYELRYGPNTFNPSEHSGHWATGYNQVIGYFYNKDENGIFTLNMEGEEKLRQLHNKFKNMDIDPYV